ncbi:uncharacterized protein LY79DRAFT_263249 [Colletotrichum navitas]|uniref:Uncharacterized protein n=1 Tax=Colletotrichum navitas TaxID=681940 RepID=A0AAD8PVZ6_9PEZI|nr:uncharacterized protein LY79DRAFT_263249 [Colletotrichum navitas]KAK1585680.1 hypothetical protein LY79DRAFT_263249 [Colletotrichum navitas]
MGDCSVARYHTLPQQHSSTSKTVQTLNGRRSRALVMVWVIAQRDGDTAHGGVVGFCQSDGPFWAGVRRPVAALRLPDGATLIVPALRMTTIEVRGTRQLGKRPGRGRAIGAVTASEDASSQTYSRPTSPVLTESAEVWTKTLGVPAGRGRGPSLH